MANTRVYIIMNIADIVNKDIHMWNSGCRNENWYIVFYECHASSTSGNNLQQWLVIWW